MQCARYELLYIFLIWRAVATTHCTKEGEYVAIDVLAYNSNGTPIAWVTGGLSAHDYSCNALARISGTRIDLS